MGMSQITLLGEIIINETAEKKGWSLTNTPTSSIKLHDAAVERLQYHHLGKASPSDCESAHTNLLVDFGQVRCCEAPRAVKKAQGLPKRTFCLDCERLRTV